MAASKLKQILQLEPAAEIAFQGPFEHVVTSYLELRNPSDRRVCFKVKTTAPKRYCVRPNSGIVDPDGKIKIAIMLQPLDPDSEAEARTKHKFMVQSTIVQSDEENIPLDEVWQNAKPDTIMDSKLRCVFHSSDQQDGDGDGGLRQQQQQRKAESSKVAADSAGGQALPSVTTTTTTTPSSIASQQAEQLARKQRSAGDGLPSELIRTSTPVQGLAARTGPSSPQTAASKWDTSSLMQPMSDDYKIVLVSLVMLVLGVILGKYII